MWICGYLWYGFMDFMVLCIMYCDWLGEVVGKDVGYGYRWGLWCWKGKILRGLYVMWLNEVVKYVNG